MKRILTLALACLLCLSAGAQKFTIHTIGDSTMADKDISRGSLERGWGMVLENFFDSEVRVVNYARNGRSTKSFIDGGLWAKVEEALRPGDYLFIQFGHNDQKSGKESVYAEAWTAYQDNLRLFIRTARSKGATPVLFTSVARRHFQEDGSFEPNNLGDYPASVRDVAAKTGTVVIDMHEATKAWISAAGDEASRPYFFLAPNGLQDNTHSSPRGARRNCEIACDSIAVKLPELAKHLVRYDFVVDQNGRGDFTKLQDAIDAVPDYLSRKITTILLKPGTYTERIIIPSSKCNLKIIGCGAEKSIITYSNHARKLWPDSTHEIGTNGSASVFVDGSFISFEDLSIRNDAGPVGQAVALCTVGDALFFNRCKIVGNQDTLYTLGRFGLHGKSVRNYFLDCYIEGTTDFIFGYGIALFENCELRSKKNSHVTAAATLQGEKYGYVFRNCRLTAQEPATSVSLGRPWRDYANVVYLGCEMGDHIKPEGWNNWGQPNREKTAFYAEYKSTGAGAKPSERLGWTHQLTDAQAAEYSFEKIMNNAGYETPWDPFNNIQPGR